MIRAAKVVGFIVGLLLYIWIADYGFILVSEKSTIAVVVGAVIFLALLGIAIAFFGWFGKKIYKKYFAEKGEIEVEQSRNTVLGDQAGRDIKKNTKRKENGKCCK